MTRGKKKIAPFIRRAFLNLEGHHTPAVVVVKVKQSGAMGIQISDCNGRIYLHEYLGNMTERTNAFYKVKALKKALEALESHLEAELSQNNMRVKRSEIEAELIRQFGEKEAEDGQ